MVGSKIIEQGLRLNSSDVESESSSVNFNKKRRISKSQIIDTLNSNFQKELELRHADLELRKEEATAMREFMQMQSQLNSQLMKSMFELINKNNLK